MKLNIYTVRDQKSKAFMQPFFSVNNETATRAIYQVLQDPTHTFSLNPEDFSVYLLSTFDDETGMITATDAPEHLFNLISITQTGE